MELQNLLDELEDIEQKEFILNMCDRWDSNDYRTSEELREKKQKIKSKINELEGV